MILLCLFLAIIQQKTICIKYFLEIYQQRGLVVTVSDWQALGSGFESRPHDQLLEYNDWNIKLISFAVKIVVVNFSIYISCKITLMT